MTETTRYPEFLVEERMTEEERATFLTRIGALNPNLIGAKVADVLEMLDNSDAYLGAREPLYEELKDELTGEDAFGPAACAAVVLAGTDAMRRAGTPGEELTADQAARVRETTRRLMTDEVVEGEPETGAELALIHPFTGELVDLGALTTDAIAAALVGFEAELGRVRGFGDALKSELVARLDRRNTRSADVGGFHLETNAPTETDYRLDVLREELAALAALDDPPIDREVLDAVIVTPPPSTPAPRVDKREVNKLRRHSDPRVVAAIAKASAVKGVNRTLKVKDLRPASEAGDE